MRNTVQTTFHKCKYIHLCSENIKRNLLSNVSFNNELIRYCSVHNQLNHVCFDIRSKYENEYTLPLDI